MKYPELSAIDSTADQDLALTIAFKLAVNQQQTQATTPGDYLAERVRAILSDYETHHVGGELVTRRADAYKKAAKADVDAADAILRVDTVIQPPDDPKA